MDVERMKRKLKEALSIARYRHSLSTSIVASKLATHYGVDSEKAMIAGLLHDCAKALSKEEQRLYIEKNGISLDEIELQEANLWHAPVGEVMAREEFGVTDPEILRAIRIHSTAAPNMSSIDKILYVADYIESYRRFKGKAYLVRLAQRDLDLTTYHILNHKLAYILHKKVMIHPNSTKARNLLVKRIFSS
jgi:predicted HD superfamily hydrolase involved in NAD metabolism